METLTHGKSSPSRIKQGIFKSPLSPGFPLGVQRCPGGGPRAAGGTVPLMGEPGRGGAQPRRGPGLRMWPRPAASACYSLGAKPTASPQPGHVLDPKVRTRLK